MANWYASYGALRLLDTPLALLLPLATVEAALSALAFRLKRQASVPGPSPLHHSPSINLAPAPPHRLP